MKRVTAVFLCLMLCLPTAGLAQDFLVSEAALAAPRALTVTLQTDDPDFQAAIEAVNSGSLLDALNTLARVTGDERAAQLSAYTQALLALQREDPASAASLWLSTSGFLDSDAQLLLTKALQTHRSLQDGAFGYVNAEGAWVVPPQFDWAERTFRRESAQWSDDGTQVVVVAKVFQGDTDVLNGDLQPVNGTYGLLRNDGTLAVPLRYTDVLWTNGGVAAVTDAQGVWLYDLPAAKVLGGPYTAVGLYREGYIPVQQDGLWGYYSPVADEMLGSGFQWQTALPFCEGLAAVSADKLYGYIDTKGSTVIPLAYQGAASFGEGLAGVRVQKRWGFINTSGTMVIEPAFAGVQSFQSGACAARKGDRWGLINTVGTWILPAKYSEITEFDPVYHRAWIRLNKLWGLVSMGGNVVLKPTWSQHDAFNGNTLCRVAYRNLYGYIDSNGKARIGSDYVQAAPFTGGYGGVEDTAGTVRYLDKAQRGFTLASDVPTECRGGFLEARQITTTETPGQDEVGRPTVTVELHIAYALYDISGKTIPVARYEAAAQP
ncbi:MAG: WG repeat-containing protein [Candidatus Limiplasma sp.]|nr:WG repeat-containing protein [Candidatus Limiplasma sp.]